ncbi:MAG TPA: aldehyde dehydrogenase family protein, partial [Verrucomicrobiae bacterium]|nr:aldehyde dehydrogenase family protein [Verrucomicrobiae bacterium]
MSTALSFPTELFIDGEFRRGSDGRSLPQTNPATEEVFCEVAAAGAADVQSAVEGAHRAFTQGWRDLAPRKRADILFGIAK